MPTCQSDDVKSADSLLPIFVTILFVLAMLLPQQRVEAQEEQDLSTQNLRKLPADPTAGDILARMAMAYADCESYRDSGEVHSVIDMGTAKIEAKQRFSTAFRRPDSFKFEFREKPWYGGDEKHYVVWGNGQGFKTWWTVTPQVKQYDTIGVAIAGPTGVSHGSAYRVPMLLLGTGRSPESLLGVGNPILLEDEEIEGIDCYVIEGKRDSEDVTKLWIEKGSLGLRKVVEKKSFSEEGFTSVTTTTYSPRFEVSLDPSVFTFEPPIDEERPSDD